MIFYHLKSNNKNIGNEFKDNMTQIKKIIFDFLMNKLYDKIFPVELDEKDSKIYQKKF